MCGVAACRPSLHNQASLADDPLSPVLFTAAVQRCATASHMAVRHLAACALAPLIPPEDLAPTLHRLLGDTHAAAPSPTLNVVRPGLTPFVCSAIVLGVFETPCALSCWEVRELPAMLLCLLRCYMPAFASPISLGKPSHSVWTLASTTRTNNNTVVVIMTTTIIIIIIITIIIIIIIYWYKNMHLSACTCQRAPFGCKVVSTGSIALELGPRHTIYPAVSNS